MQQAGTIVAIALGLCACSSLPPIKPKAASSLACSEGQVTVESTSLVDIARGCGRTDIMTLEDGKWASLRERAAFEMSCDASQLDVTVLSGTQFGVSGCGRKLVYKKVPYVAGLVADTASKEGP